MIMWELKLAEIITGKDHLDIAYSTPLWIDETMKPLLIDNDLQTMKPPTTPRLRTIVTLQSFNTGNAL